MRRQQLQKIPPSPEVILELYSRYMDRGAPEGLTFREFLVASGYTNPASDVEGMDDGKVLLDRARAGLAEIDLAEIDISAPLLLQLPEVRVVGDLEVVVVLIDFPDKIARTSPEHYERLWFDTRSQGVATFYDETSHGQVSITGTVHGWFRMPEPYSTYTNNESGMRPESYPRNAQRMAEDAVRTALSNGVRFSPGLDKFGRQTIASLVLVHAGRGAEGLEPEAHGTEIWSHKWTMTQSIDVGGGLSAFAYMTVAEDGRVGVCAHELGHLTFQWQDFYDSNSNHDEIWWDGSGMWDLMAGGAHNAKGESPAHPAALHKSQHGWITLETMAGPITKKGVTIKPHTAKKGTALRLQSPRFKPGQYLLLENRQRSGFDRALPGRGLLVWRVDQAGEQHEPGLAGMTLIQADGRNDLSHLADGNLGDPGDPFPGSSAITALSDSGETSTSFPGQPESGITLSNITLNQSSTNVILDVEIR